MGINLFRCLGILAVLAGLAWGCASKSSSSAAAPPAPARKGHWVTMPPETGSYISRRVWVEDNGQTNGSPALNNVQSGSSADFQRIQNTTHSGRPPGS